MITHYGLSWKAADVLWSRWRNAPSALLGREKEPLGRKGAPTVEQRNNAKDYGNFVGVYCLYGEGELIYIGEAGLDTGQNLFWRLKEHRKGGMSGRWDTFSWFGRANCNDDVPSKAALQQLEAIAIAIINPGFNKQSGAFAKAKQVYQVAHDFSEGDISTRLARMEAALGEIRSKLETKK